MTAYQRRAQHRRDHIVALAEAHPDWTSRHIAKVAHVGFQLVHYHLKRAGFRTVMIRVRPLPTPPFEVVER